MKRTIKEVLIDKIPEDKLSLVKRSFEIVGDIAITEIPEELNEYENLISEAILQTNTSLNTVLKKEGIHEGEFRTQKLTFVGGENKKETLYKENGIKLLINPETIYFSPRLSTEREYLASKVEENEHVLVLFSGVGPYTFVILKKQPNLQKITSVELNPQGHQYAIKNQELNKNLLRRSDFFKNLKFFFKENQIQFHEGQLLQNLNSLRIELYNEDAKNFSNFYAFEEKDFSHSGSDSNQLLKKNPKEVVNTLQKHKSLLINLDELKNAEDLIPFVVLFAHKYTFNIIINEKKFVCKNNKDKSFLLSLLETGNTKYEISKFDRIMMPLPKDASNFLDNAFSLAKKGATIHMYDFVHEEDFPYTTEQAVLDTGKRHNRLVEIIETRKVGQYSPGKYRVCCDFKILD